MPMKRIVAIIAGLLCLAALQAQEVPSHDWANFGRYEKADAAVTARPKAVLLGDSITDGWYAHDQEFFSANGFVGRGISGQVTAQMLVRFRRDVIDLKPKYVVILAGINDIARNDGYISIENTFGNLVSMCELARANKIKPVLCTLLPSYRFPWRPAIKDVREQVESLNSMIREYARRNRIKLVDYAPLLADGEGNTRKDLSGDSVHPNLDGYKIMEEALLKVLK